MLRILLLAPLGLAMLTAAEEHKMNMSDVKASRSKHDAAVKDAQEAFAVLNKTAFGLKSKAALLSNHTELESMVNKLYIKAGKNASTKAILHDVEVAREKEKKDLQGMASHAKKSARAVLHTARNVQHVSKHAGVPERVWEKEYGVAERIGEHLQDEVGDLSGDAREALADIYSRLGAQLEDRLEREEKAKREAERKAKEAAKTKAAEERMEAAKKAEEERKEKSSAKGNFLSPDKSQQLAAFSARSLDNVAMLGCAGFLSVLGMVLYAHFRRTQPVIGSYPSLG